MSYRPKIKRKDPAKVRSNCNGYESVDPAVVLVGYVVVADAEYVDPAENRADTLLRHLMAPSDRTPREPGGPQPQYCRCLNLDYRIVLLSSWST